MWNIRIYLLWQPQCFCSLFCPSVSIRILHCSKGAPPLPLDALMPHYYLLSIASIALPSVGATIKRISFIEKKNKQKYALLREMKWKQKNRKNRRALTPPIIVVPPCIVRSCGCRRKKMCTVRVGESLREWEATFNVHSELEIYSMNRF